MLWTRGARAIRIRSDNYIYSQFKGHCPIRLKVCNNIVHAIQHLPWLISFLNQEHFGSLKPQILISPIYTYCDKEHILEFILLVFAVIPRQLLCCSPPEKGEFWVNRRGTKTIRQISIKRSVITTGSSYSLVWFTFT